LPPNQSVRVIAERLRRFLAENKVLMLGVEVIGEKVHIIEPAVHVPLTPHRVESRAYAVPEIDGRVVVLEGDVKHRLSARRGVVNGEPARRVNTAAGHVAAMLKRGDCAENPALKTLADSVSPFNDLVGPVGEIVDNISCFFYRDNRLCDSRGD
jgi:hypothetical protein